MTLRHGEQNSLPPPPPWPLGPLLGSGSELAVPAPPLATELETADPTSDPPSSLDPEHLPEEYRDLQLLFAGRERRERGTMGKLERRGGGGGVKRPPNK
jgi:hypothetical protein